MLVVGWSADGAPFDKAEHTDELPYIVGFEIEVTELDAFYNQRTRRLAQRLKAEAADAPQKKCVGLKRSVAGLYARVRAYNKFGFGEWSDESELMALEPLTPEEQTPLEEIPAAWVDLDLGGLDEYKEALEPAALLANKERLLRSLFDNRNVIKVAFAFYALSGAADVEVDPDVMSMLQFTTFAQSAGLLRSAGLKELKDLDLIFLRAARDPKLSSASGEAMLIDAVESSGVPVGEGWKKVALSPMQKLKAGIADVVTALKGANQLNQTQYVGALLRSAAQMYSSSTTLTLDAKLTRLCIEHIQPHVYDELQLIKDEFSQVQMVTRSMHSVLGRHAANLLQVFKVYAASDTTGDGTWAGAAAAKASAGTMNVRELEDMCEACGLFDESFTTLKLLAIFVKVNIDDDLFEQENDENNSAELVYDEFEEVMARIFDASVYQPVLTGAEDDADADANPDADATTATTNDRHGYKPRLAAVKERLRAEEEMRFEAAFHEWLESAFLPTALAACKTKKRSNVVGKWKAAVAGQLAPS